MKNKLFLLLFLSSLSFTAKAQLGFLLSGEIGLAGSTVKTEEIPVFLASYNEIYTGLSQKFEMKQGMATGNYFHFMVGMGSKECMATFGIGRYLMTTSANEARFSDGTGRDISTEIRDASTEFGIRFEQERFTAGFQFVLSLRTVSIYSKYVFADGSKSIGGEHTMNGVYEDLAFGPGLGMNLGFKLLPTVWLVAKADYVFRTGKSHPEYHQFDDGQYTRDLYYNLPRDVAEYISNPYNASENAISNDIRGLRFGVGLQICLSTFEFD